MSRLGRSRPNIPAVVRAPQPAPVVTGAAALPLGGVALSASGTVGHPGSAALPLGGALLAASGTVGHPGSAALPLGGVALTASAAVTDGPRPRPPVVVGQATRPHPSWRGANTIFIADTPVGQGGDVTGAAALPLGGVTLAASATVKHPGAAALPLGGAALAASATVTPVGTGGAALPLGTLTLVAAGTVRHPGSASLTLGPLLLAATGTVRRPGSVALPLGVLTLVGQGAVRRDGASVLPLGGLTLIAVIPPPVVEGSMSAAARLGPIQRPTERTLTTMRKG